MLNNTVTYDLIVDGALVPIQNLTIGINYDGPYIPEFEYVNFTGSPKIAAEEGSATKQITIVEFKGGTKVGSATFSGSPFSSNSTFDLGATPGKYDIVSYGIFSGEFDAYTSSASLTQMAGTQIGQSTTDQQAIKPFAGVTITDAPPTSTGDDNDVLTITSSNLANGVLSDPNQATDGGHFVGDSYVLLGMGAALTKDVDSLVFTPTEHQVAPGQSVTTTFTLNNQNLNEFGTTTEIASVVTTASSATDVTYVTGAASGHAVLTGTNGADDITARGADNLILAHGGNDIINAGDGGAIVQASGGNKSIALGGAFNLVTGGDGNDIVYGAPGGMTAVTLGNGNDVVDLGGNSNFVLLGNGNDRVFVSGGMSFISTGSGVDDVTIDGSNNTINTGGGINDITATGTGNMFVLPKAFSGFDTINGPNVFGGVDFLAASGDKLDLRNALAATTWNGSASTLGQYVHIDQEAATIGFGVNYGISISLNGVGSGQQIASLANQVESLTLGALVGAHALIT